MKLTRQHGMWHQKSTDWQLNPVKRGLCLHVKRVMDYDMEQKVTFERPDVICFKYKSLFPNTQVISRCLEVTLMTPKLSYAIKID